MKIDFKKSLPILLAIIIFVVIVVIFFNPVFKDKQIGSHDIMQHQGASKEVVDFRKINGEEALWTNSMFGGMPAYQISTLYPNNWLKHIDNLFMLWLPHPAGMVFLYFFGFFILLLCLRVDPRIAIVGAIGYGFSSYFFIIFAAGHNTKAHAIGYLAPLLGSIILTLRGTRVLGAALTALFGGLELYCNHVQVTYYFMMLLMVILAFELYGAIKDKKIKSFFIACCFLLLAGIIGVLPNITNLWTTYEYGKYSNRGKTELTIQSDGRTNKDIVTEGVDKIYATQYSYGIGETFTFLVPNFKGGASEPISKNNKETLKKMDPQDREMVGSFGAYFGAQPQTSGPVYIGVIMCALALLGIFIIKSRLKWALLVGTVLTVMLGWGKNLMWFSDFFFDHFPAYNKFRAVTIILIIAELTIPLLAVLALDTLVKSYNSGDHKISIFKKEYELKKVVFASFGFVAGLLLLFYVLPEVVNSFDKEGELEEVVRMEKNRNMDVSEQQITAYVAPVLDKVAEARKVIFKKDVLLRLMLLVLGFIPVFLLIRKKISVTVFSILLGIFVMADMWPVVARYINKDSYVKKQSTDEIFLPSKADEFILSDKTPDYRVLSLDNPFNNAAPSYFHKSIGGYHGAKLKRYQELVEFRIFDEIQSMYAVLGKPATDSMVNEMLKKEYVLNMLNTKYVILDANSQPLVNRQAYGNAWFVTKINYVPTADEEITKLGKVNPRWYAIVNEKYKASLGTFDPVYDSTATIKLTSYAPNKLVYESNAKKDQLAVFSEIYYPKGWNAYVDGNLTEHINADYVLRAMKVPAGKHAIEFKFEPDAYYTGEKIAFIGSVLVLLVLAGGIVYYFKKERNVDLIHE